MDIPMGGIEKQHVAKTKSTPKLIEMNSVPWGLRKE